MNMLREEIKDKRLIELIKKYLKSGVMENGTHGSEEEYECTSGMAATQNKSEESDEVRYA